MGFSLRDIVQLVPDIRVKFGVGHSVSEGRIDMFMEFSAKRKVMFLHSYRDDVAWMKYDHTEPIFIYNRGYFNKSLVAHHLSLLSSESNKDFFLLLFEFNLSQLNSTKEDQLKHLKTLSHVHDIGYILYGYHMKDYVEEKLRVPFFDET